MRPSGAVAHIKMLACCGVWALEPDESNYGIDSVPRSAVYTILPEAQGFWFHVRWCDCDGEFHQTSFRGATDREIELGNSAGRLATWVEDDALITEVRHGGEAMVTARRWVEDDRLLVTQRHPDGETRSVYRPAAVKQVMVYRRDLAMRKGKIAAQCAHASMAVFFSRDNGPVDRLSVGLDGPMSAWARGRFGKVVLSVEGEAELLEIEALARARALPTALITDSGKTEFHGRPTRTTVAVGPAADFEVDAITGPQGAVTTKLA